MSAGLLSSAQFDDELKPQPKLSDHYWHPSSKPSSTKFWQYHHKLQSLTPSAFTLMITQGGDLLGSVFLNNSHSDQDWNNAFRLHLTGFKQQYGPDNVKY